MLQPQPIMYLGSLYLLPVTFFVSVYNPEPFCLRHSVNVSVYNSNRLGSQWQPRLGLKLKSPGPETEKQQETGGPGRQVRDHCSSHISNSHTLLWTRDDNDREGFMPVLTLLCGQVKKTLLSCSCCPSSQCCRICPHKGPPWATLTAPFHKGIYDTLLCAYSSP